MYFPHWRVQTTERIHEYVNKVNYYLPVSKRSVLCVGHLNRNRENEREIGRWDFSIAIYQNYYPRRIPIIFDRDRLERMLSVNRTVPTEGQRLWTDVLHRNYPKCLLPFVNFKRIVYKLLIRWWFWAGFWDSQDNVKHV